MRLLVAAERPIIVSGGGVAASDAAAELRELAETLSIPVVTSLTGKDALPDNHPLSIGLVGSYGRQCANELVAEADLVFFVGSRAGGLTTDRWKAPAGNTSVIQLDINPAEIGRNYQVKVGLLGDAKVTLRRMIGRAEATACRATWVRRAQDKLREWRTRTDVQANATAVPMRPERLCKEISDCLPVDAVVVADTGHAAIWSGTMIRLVLGQRYIHCAGTLGWGFPGAIGVKCALPKRPVLCFIGDGGMLFHLSELETAARNGINVVVLVNNNGALSQTIEGYNKAYGGSQRGRAHEMWKYRDVNFAKVAEEMGCLGIRIDRPEKLSSALARAFSADRPAVVDVVTDFNALPEGPWG
jgi:acetolactate synthase-1/2/3 large subunit